MAVRIERIGMAVAENEAAPPMGMAPRMADKSDTYETPELVAVDEPMVAEPMMPEAVMPDEPVAMTHESGMADAMSAAVEAHSTATAVEPHSSAASAHAHSTAAAAAKAAAPAAATSAELVVIGRLRLHRIDRSRLLAGGDRNRVCYARRRQQCRGGKARKKC
jgi:hypothetical protein